VSAPSRHASYWQGLALVHYRGGPFADRTGGLILFDSDSAQDAVELVSGDPFVHERLLERRWVKEWHAEAAGTHDGGGTRKERTDR
jgi:YCII-related domain